jgi:hypothetical protein
MKRIPYGLSDYERIKTEKYYYIDKTRHIHTLEEAPDFLFFLRPRRFGKSLLVNMLIAYYDVNYKSKFQALFGDTYIYANPTKRRHSYCIMKFDFSAVDITRYNESFRVNLLLTIKNFVEDYHIDLKFASDNPIDRFRELFDHCSKNNLPIYIFIDEYDNFVNKLLVNDMGNYKDAVTTKEALYKQFFTMLKVGTSSNNSAIRKMFFTGVSPLALYDVTSGSNIGSNISLNRKFNDFTGVTQDELINIIKHYQLEDKKDLIVMRCNEWYNSYRFHSDVEHTIYNSDMILYYIYHLKSDDKEPSQLIDVNVRTDYSKLKYLVYTNQKLNGNFDLLSRLLRDEQVSISELKDNFSAFEMLQSANFSSFLFALGFVTMEKNRLNINLKIPNQTIKKIVADFIENAYRDIDFNVQLQRFNEHLANFALDGDLEVFRYLNDEVKKQSSIRDYIEGEAFMKGFLIAYLSLNPFYEVKSEAEITKGYVDILLNPIRDEISYGAVIEIKYISKSNYTKELEKQKIQEAKEQLLRYDVTKVPNLKQKEFLKVVLIYRSWELIYCELVGEAK